MSDRIAPKLLAEFIGTFALIFIGAGAAAVIGGGAGLPGINPARALGPMVATGNFSGAWLYLTAPIVGAIVAAILHMGLVRLAHEGMAAAEPGRAAQTPAK